MDSSLFSLLHQKFPPRDLRSVQLILPVFSIPTTFPPSGMWGCEGEDGERTKLKSIYSVFSANLYIFELFNNYFMKSTQDEQHVSNAVIQVESYIKAFIIKDLLFNVVVIIGHFLWAICWGMEIFSLYIYNQT